MQLNKIKQKKGAIELSIGTVVIIVLAVSMLILGIVLIGNIFSGATSTIDDLDDNVKAQLKGLFQNDQDRAVISLTENTAVVEQGTELKFAFIVRNTEQGTTSSQTYNYQVELDNKGNCPSDQQALQWVAFDTGSFSVQPGQVNGDLIGLRIPEDAPLCEAKYRIIITRPGVDTAASPYASLPFFVKIKGSGLF